MVVTQGVNKGEHGCGARGEHGYGTRGKHRCGARGGTCMVVRQEERKGKEDSKSNK